jgi:tRNA-uridine 2-sulfurtransferase
VVKVLSLFSGSLASRVATKLVEQHTQVSSVQLLYFRSPFSHECEELRQLVKSEWSSSTYRTQSIKKDYQDLVSLTGEGAFSLAQSCRSCQSLLLSKTARYMDRIGAEFVVTGCIPGKHGLTAQDASDVAARTGLEGRILNPLLTEDPRQLPVDLAAWANRKPQTRNADDMADLVLQLAGELGLQQIDPVNSRIRCKLMIPGFGERVAALFKEEVVTLNALCLLDFPLYFKADPDLRIVLASDENEKRELQNYFLPQDLRLYPATPHGPMTLLRTNWETKTEKEKSSIIEFVAKLTATYARVDGMATIPVYYRLESQDERQLLNVEPFASVESLAMRDDLRLIPLHLPVQRVLAA